MLESLLTESSHQSVEMAVAQVSKLWGQLNQDAPPAHLTFAGDKVQMELGAVASAAPVEVWEYAVRLGLNTEMELGAQRVVLVLGLEFGVKRAEHIMRDGIALTIGLVAGDARPWLEGAFQWRATTWRNVKEAAFVRYLEQCESRQLRRLVVPMFLARWNWIEKFVVAPWRDILPQIGN